MKPLVYVAGPYTNPDPVLNTREACAVADALVDIGAAPVIPHLSLLWHAISPQGVDEWYARDLDVMRHCHAVVRFPGASTGADKEVAQAEEWGIPVFFWDTEDVAVTRWIFDWSPGPARVPGSVEAS